MNPNDTPAGRRALRLHRKIMRDTQAYLDNPSVYPATHLSDVKADLEEQANAAWEAITGQPPADRIKLSNH